MYFQLAWRNIWRNSRRTIVIITAVAIGVWSMVFLSAFSRGMLNSMLENGKSVLVGDIQIHHKNYREDPSIDKSMERPDVIRVVLENSLPQDALWAERIKVSAFVSNARHSSGVTLVGIDPKQEERISFVGRSIIKGTFLEESDKRGVLVGKALLDKFDTKIGKKLILMTRDKNGKVVSKAFRIRGIYRAEMESTEKSYLFITMSGARNLLNMQTGISEISIVLPDEEMVDAFGEMLQEKLDTRLYSVETWKDLLPMLEAYLGMFNSFMYIWYVVVFIAMGFGIVNTSLMAVFERVREFGLLRALGMKPWWVIRSVLTESIFILMVGILTGNALGMISVFLMKENGINLAMFGKGAEFFGMSRIIYPVLTLNDVMSVNYVIFFLGVFVSFYPAIRAAQITPVEAMRE
ncbi:MAG: ABC transporter permease [Desulfobacteraceae bacterium]|nr:ABC transporter permease [Desulfobacteraceae bacterium]